MTVHKYYIGGMGPYLYDDTVSLLDPDGDFPGDNQYSFITSGKVKVEGSPTDGDDVLRLDDLESLVIGPSSSTDNAIARFDGTTGKLLQDSALILDNNGDLSKTGDLEIDCGSNNTLELTQPVWDDLRTPINIAAKLPGKEPAEVVYRSGIVYEFNTANDEGCAFNVQLSHAYKLGTDIEFHIHYVLRTAGAGTGAENVKWDFTHSWADIGDAMPTETSVSKTIDVQSLSADTHYLGEIADTIDGSGISGVSSMLICSLTRDTSVANNYSDDVLVMEVDFHYQIDTLGSRQEAVK